MDESSATAQGGAEHFSWYPKVCVPLGETRALPSSSLSSTPGSRGRFVACPRVSRLKLRASTVTASAVNPLLVMENSPRHFLPHSTMMGETVWAETASPKNENCRSSRDKTFFMLRIPSVQKNKCGSVSTSVHSAACYEFTWPGR